LPEIIAYNDRWRVSARSACGVRPGRTQWFWR